MTKIIRIPISLQALLLSLIVLSGCAMQESSNYTEHESLEAARLFVLNSPTYQFNGNNLELLDSGTLPCDDCFIFIFSFRSAFAGYGDRSGEIPIEVQTENMIDVIVRKGEVIQSTINNEWNEILQREIVDYEVIDGTTKDRIPTYYCSEPRPEACTMEVDPVCGSDKKDYSNGCSACSNSRVKWYTRGECVLGYQDRVLQDINQGKITKDSGPVLILFGWELMD